ncbi:MAG TPA: tRNA (N(6)-L-threonylcarbamoyladenosine(37)-C(2))-methylthiotransferase MtaB [Bacteroidia bacterium]|jgi:threonylcarbamoyladenosine tRNA methylthiotransferase MtaB|nr:tRNA (N(6)-L-threonylcarbamoyladenosine(37)-C(2))-methylthiotransferase MtaB [Bacteroidia bacterium]
MNTRKTVAFHTLGCKLNFAETSSIARSFEKNGYLKKDFSEPADVYVLNTCSVTENADKECRQIIRNVRKIAPQGIVAVIGCYAQLKPNDIGAIEGVDLVLGAKEKFNLLQYVNSISKTDKAEVHSCEIEETHEFISSYSAGDRTRSFLKVQDGCDYTCSYCTIPLARGKSRSDSIDNVVKQANEIAAQGIKEIVLTGVNIGDFGTRHAELVSASETQNTKNVFGKKETFLDLITELEKVESIDRFRISSIEPNLLKDEIIEFVARSKRFVPHFHIPLQSGSNKILKGMRRRYQRDLYTGRVNAIKKQMPHACIGVDVIVGFPGETEEDFMETYNFLNTLDISYLHVFTYSERPDTDALEIKPVVPVHIRKERNKMLRILSEKKQRAFYTQHLSTNRDVLFETENKNGFINGFTDNYIKVSVPFTESLINKLENSTLLKLNEEGVCAGEIVKSKNLEPAEV